MKPIAPKHGADSPRPLHTPTPWSLGITNRPQGVLYSVTSGPKTVAEVHSYDSSNGDTVENQAKEAAISKPEGKV